MGHAGAVLAVVLVLAAVLPLSLVAGAMRGLTLEQWTVLAAIAQIVAGVLAAVNIWQAARSSRQTARQLQLSVAPDWEVRGPSYVNTTGQPDAKVDIVLVNTGFGPARRPHASFEPVSEIHPTRCEAQKRAVVMAERELHVDLAWPCREETVGIHSQANPEVEGTLVLTSETRLGATVTARFRVGAWYTGSGQASFWAERIEEGCPARP